MNVIAFPDAADDLVVWCRENPEEAAVLIERSIRALRTLTKVPRDAERETIARCANIAAQAAKRCVRERIPGDSVAAFIERAILALPSIPSREGVEREPISQDAKTIAQTAHAIINRLTEENKAQREALQIIADWQNTRIGDEHEHSLRDIIRSITDCADRALSPSPTSVMSDEGKQK